MKTDSITQFVQYVDSVVLPATEDLEKLDDANRQHVQRLVYTNLVDRFDSAVDVSLMMNCREEYLCTKLLEHMDQTVSEAELLRLLMNEAGVQVAIDARLQNALRNTALRQRHSKKLEMLLATFGHDLPALKKPRVNISTGDILNKMTPQIKTTPHSICGYADWLYSRRNAIVHGSGSTKLLPNDIEQLKKLYQCAVIPSFRIKLASVTNAVTFYKSVAQLLLEIPTSPVDGDG
jgi:hypothetical protein